MTVLAKLREDIDIIPSPIADRPGLLLHDPLRYSDAAIVLPPLLVRCLGCFDGAHTDLDLRSTLSRLTGREHLDHAADALIRGLSEGGFLDDQTFHSMRAERRRSFAESPVRVAAFAGGGYPDDQATLTRTLRSWTTAPPLPTGSGSPGGALRSAARAADAIAAPHVSPIGGVTSYGAAYRALDASLADRTFVILATSHYGRPNRMGVTRKSFQTPLGEASTDVQLVNRLALAAPAVIDVEDYCHAVEHSIEFQVVFLQNLFGPTVRILPILCGPFISSEGRPPTPGSARYPEEDAGVARALDALGELEVAHSRQLVWVMGVDMAHMGRRYGDDFDAQAHHGMMAEVADRDQARLDRVVAGDAHGFWDLVHERGADELKWCGSAPLYAFLHAHPNIDGRVLHYDQWNIDERSVVSFAALAFHRG